jgi:carboxypeptidase PM20D1
VADTALQIRAIGPQVEPSPVSPSQGEAWTGLVTAVRRAYPDALVAPYLVVGATDARHFRELSPNIYRFTPTVMGSEDLERFHGTNERIPVDAYLSGIRFYAELLRGFAG